MVQAFISGVETLFIPAVFLSVAGGTVLGVVLGAMPGVSASIAVVLALPVAYAMDSVTAAAFLSAVYCASITGGGITAILFRVPGTPSSAPTTLDGYPMARRGEGGKALGFSVVSSMVGGLAASLAMILFCPLISEAAQMAGPSERFALFFLSIAVLVVMDNHNFIKALMSAVLGLLIACGGRDPVTGSSRLLWGDFLPDMGRELIPIMIGLFAVGGVLGQTGKERRGNRVWQTENGGKTRILFPSFKELWAVRFSMVRASVLGILVGILPGAGATSASFLSYAIEKRLSKHPERMGTGVPEGIVAAEAANNGATGGSMVPLLALGIPGGNAVAIIMAFLLARNVEAGPGLVREHPEYLASVFGSMVLTSVLMVLAVAVVARGFAKLLLVKYNAVGPLIVMVAAAGAYGLNQDMKDVALMIGFGIGGYFLIRMGYSLAAFVLGMVIGPMWEQNFYQAYMLAEGNSERIFTRPVTVLIMAVSILILLYPLVKLSVEREKS